jgi:hypothetical protein
MTIFAAIASFTKDGWSVDIPLVGWILGSNSIGSGFLGSKGLILFPIFATGLLTLIFAIIGLISARKITDIEAMKSSWKCTRNFFILVTVIEVFKMIAIALIGLFGIGEKSKVAEGYLWLNGFLGNTLAAIGAAAVAFISHMIANGKTQVLSMMRFVALGVAGVALILGVVTTFVNFYSGCSDSDYKCLLKEAKKYLDD